MLIVYQSEITVHKVEVLYRADISELVQLPLHPLNALPSIQDDYNTEWRERHQ